MNQGNMRYNRKKDKRRDDKENFYLTSDEIYVEWKKWKDSAEKIEDRIPSIGICQQIQTIAEKMLHSKCFIYYNVHVKEDMKQAALLKCLRNLKNLKEEKKEAFFNYLTRTCWCAFLDVINRQNKYYNLQNNIYADIENIEQMSQMTFEQLMRKYSGHKTSGEKR